MERTKLAISTELYELTEDMELIHPTLLTVNEEKKLKEKLANLYDELNLNELEKIDILIDKSAHRISLEGLSRRQEHCFIASLISSEQSNLGRTFGNVPDFLYNYGENIDETLSKNERYAVKEMIERALSI